MKKAYKQEIEMWNRVFAECTQEDLIRQYNEDDIDAVMQIWLDTNIRAHNFISSGYWRINFDMVREMLPHAEIYVHEEDCAR